MAWLGPKLGPLLGAVLATTLLAIAVPTRATANEISEPSQDPLASFRLFRTQNVFTQLKLDTRTGQIWQVQWSTGKYGFSEVLNAKVLAVNGRVGRFTLSPTSNIYTFVLLDQDTGSTWQVQWGTADNRFIIPI